MSFKIEIRAAGLSLSANLKDEALIMLLQLVQEKRDDSIATPANQNSPAALPLLETEPANEGIAEDSIKAMLHGRGGADLLNQLKWESFPEKILLLAAWHEARGGTTPWRSSDMDDVFGLAKEGSPSNFPRDIRNAIKSGWIHNETPRTYLVTRTGWNRIGQALRALSS